MERPDPHSFSQPQQVRVRHVGAAWLVSFADKTLSGRATLRIERAVDDAPLRLDTRGLDIERIELGVLPREISTQVQPPAIASLGDAGQWRDATWQLGETDEHLGQPLVVELDGDADLVRVHYSTRPMATGLQWLEPEQTADPSAPFLYSQSQAIHARSWLPCQDSPGVRFTYDAELTVAGPLQAVMAARSEGSTATDNGQVTYRFLMPEPIPAYLLALAVGHLEFRELGPRTGVWAEGPVVVGAADELADMERMLAATEALYGPYRWGRYDVLVLPASFPFGGMENPRLTFATPTILAGDRSLVSLIAHEMAHSWSGNLVTNATWSDFWLNEGFTTYIERRILEAVYGRERAEMEAYIGLLDLRSDFAGAAKDPKDQHLKLDLRGRDPDDGMTSVAYEKGAMLLRVLEDRVGRAQFDAFLRRWFDDHAFESATTEEFVQFATSHLGAKNVADLPEWIDAPGLPEAPVRDDVFAPVASAVDGVVAGKLDAKELEKRGWTPHQWLYFLQTMDEKGLDARGMEQLDAALNLTQTGNYEVLAKWLVLAVRHGFTPADERLERFLVHVGRRKFLTPLYEVLLSVDGGRARARAIYGKARAGYHAITRRTIDDLLDWSEQ